MTCLRLIIALLVLVAAGELLAQTVYRWVDENGEVHYGHAVPPEHAARGYDRLGPDGTVRERVGPALPPEALAERREQLRREAEEADRQRSQETSDRLLLATFRSEEDLMTGLNRQLIAINSQRSSINTAINMVENRFATLVGHAAEPSRNNRPVPEPIQDSIRDTRAELRRLRRDLAGVEAREQQLRESYQADLERFRELTGRRSN